MRPVGFISIEIIISLEIREGGVRGGRDHERSELREGWRIYFLVFFPSFFSCFFSVRFWGVLEGTFGVRRVLWVSFGTHFGVIFVTF